MTDENQHWVPKLLLKPFADSDGRIYRLDIQTDHVSKPPPRNAASAPGFNNFQIEGEIVSFERKLEKVETKAAPVLKRIVDARALTNLTPKDRKKVSDFVTVQSFRTEAFYKGLGSESPRHEFGSFFRRLWESAFILSAMIEARHWALMVIENDDIFYLGDQPVVLQRTHDPKNGSNLGFDVKGVEAFLPLSPKCALYLPCRSVSHKIIARYHAAMSLHKAVRTAVFRGVSGEAAELKMAQETIRLTHELYQAFTTGSPIKAQKPHIENLNYLQCSWAHAGIYSNRRDFTFARHVFKKSPQYRSTPNTRLLDGTALVPDSAKTLADGW
ncbi:MAG TPA: DUF4238 domain-containing protein [Tardiphaga sp.]